MADADHSGPTSAKSGSLVTVSATTDYDVTTDDATLVAGVEGKYKLTLIS